MQILGKSLQNLYFLCKSYAKAMQILPNATQILFKSYANPVPMLCKYYAKRIANGSASYASPMQACANAMQFLHNSQANLSESQ